MVNGWSLNPFTRPFCLNLFKVNPKVMRACACIMWVGFPVGAAILWKIFFCCKSRSGK